MSHTIEMKTWFEMTTLVHVNIPPYLYIKLKRVYVSFFVLISSKHGLYIYLISMRLDETKRKLINASSCSTIFIYSSHIHLYRLLLLIIIHDVHILLRTFESYIYVCDCVWMHFHGLPFDVFIGRVELNQAWRSVGLFFIFFRQRIASWPQVSQRWSLYFCSNNLTCLLYFLLNNI